jgi:hypothetical protein
MLAKITTFLVLAGLWGCTDSPLNPVHSPVRALTASASACAPSPDIVVHTNGELQEAADTAHPGSTIAIAGTIVETGDVDVPTDGLTFTCATPGSGLAATPGIGINWLLVIRSRHVTVQELRLDAREALDGATLAVNDPDENAVAGDFHFLDNDVACGPGQCLFLVSAQFGAGQHASVAGNRFVANGSATGPQIQNFQYVTLQDNVVEAEAPSGNGIIVNSGLHINATGNQVLGPWETSFLYVDGVFESTAANNQFTGSSLNGIFVGGTRGVQVVNNRVATSGSVAIFVARACSDVIVQNTFPQEAAATVFFGPATGANLYVGDLSGAEDDGNRDCDGDGTFDPNRLRGT